MINNGRIKEVFLEIYRPLGWPHSITLETTFNHLPHYWNRLKREGLIPPGISYNQFVKVAQIACQEKWVKSVHNSFLDD